MGTILNTDTTDQIADKLKASADYYEACARDMRNDAELVRQTFIAEHDEIRRGFKLKAGRRYWDTGEKILEQPNDSRMWMPKQW